MNQAARNSIGLNLLGALCACAGDAAYRWWRHGAVDWVGVLEFGIGWMLATMVIQLFIRGRQKRAEKFPAEGTAPVNQGN